MRRASVFVYEFITGGGCWSWGVEPSGGLLAEGAAMLQAIATDFAAIAESVHVLWDARLSPAMIPLPANVTLHPIANADEERAAFQRLADQCSNTLVIAPETNGALRDRSRWAEATSTRLLSPSSEFIAVTGDKNRTAELLSSAGIAVPAGVRWTIGEAWPPFNTLLPCVIKPADGCGSTGVRKIITHADFGPPPNAGIWRIEQFQPGVAASIAFLCGDKRSYPLPATRQRLSQDGRFTYLGGELPLSADWQQRAERLASAALAALPPAQGYVGFDLILGEACSGAEDFLVEVNPRLTTSYIGLRELCTGNLASAMCDVQFEETTQLAFRTDVISFAVK